jgi:hypothetical protein
MPLARGQAAVWGLAKMIHADGFRAVGPDWSKDASPSDLEVEGVKWEVKSILRDDEYVSVSRRPLYRSDAAMLAVVRIIESPRDAVVQEVGMLRICDIPDASACVDEDDAVLGQAFFRLPLRNLGPIFT